MGRCPEWKMLMEVRDWEEGVLVAEEGDCPIYDPSCGKAY